MGRRLQWIFADAVLTVVNSFIDFFTGGLRRPVFFDADRAAPELSRLPREFPRIRRELDALLARNANLPRYHELDPHLRRISEEADPKKNWRVFLLHAMGETPADARRLCPETTEVVLRIPDLFQAFFSILEGGKSVPAHAGPYRGYLRYHLGLRVPREKPPRMRIKDRWHEWKEGEGILFDDSWEHEVVNESREPRAVLIVDVLRPLPPLPAAMNRWFVRRIVRPLYGRRLIKNLR